tara:strand:- start:605 stop:988 length:384 start_codon:yes stop_codon:yes gene_type:complete
MNLKEIKKMVITSLIQERVGYSNAAMDGDAGGEADPPDIQGIVDDAEKEIQQMIAAQGNIIDAVATEIAEMAAPCLVQAGVPGDEVVKLVSDFLTQMHDAVNNAKEKRKQLGAGSSTPELNTKVGAE